jgi:hypothetical protein
MKVEDPTTTQKDTVGLPSGFTCPPAIAYQQNKQNFQNQPFAFSIVKSTFYL